MSETVVEKAIHVEPPVRSRKAIVTKRFVQGLFGLLVVPRRLALWLSWRILGRQAFVYASESIARVPGIWGVYLRHAFYRQTLTGCGQDVYFGWQSTFSMREACVGDRAYIGRNCSIGFGDIGEDVMLADGVQILSGGHEHGGESNEHEVLREQSQAYHCVRIGRGAWIGAGAIVMADVGEAAIIGAGAVVNKPIPDRCVAVGVPARVVKHLEGDS